MPATWEEKTVAWFKATWKERTAARGTNIDWVNPEYRICWSEVWVKMTEFGYRFRNAVDARTDWDEVFKAHGLKKFTERNAT